MSNTATKTTPDRDALVAALAELQGATSNRAFGQMLGVSGQAWANVLNAKSRMGQPILSAVLRRYPQLTDDVIAYMKRDDAATPEPVSAR